MVNRPTKKTMRAWNQEWNLWGASNSAQVPRVLAISLLKHPPRNLTLWPRMGCFETTQKPYAFGAVRCLLQGLSRKTPNSPHLPCINSPGSPCEIYAQKTLVLKSRGVGKPQGKELVSNEASHASKESLGLFCACFHLDQVNLWGVPTPSSRHLLVKKV